MRSKARRKVLLIEPNYANKFPPIGLMKISTYYRNLGNWDVVFYKGDLMTFVIERIGPSEKTEYLTISKLANTKLWKASELMSPNLDCC